MSSNIPEARRILQEAIAGDNSYDSTSMYGAIVQALSLMDRKKPEFVAPRVIKPLSDAAKKEVKRLRAQGMGINAIAHKLGTNHGRVSEALSEKT